MAEERKSHEEIIEELKRRMRNGSLSHLNDDEQSLVTDLLYPVRVSDAADGDGIVPLQGALKLAVSE